MTYGSIAQDWMVPIGSYVKSRMLFLNCFVTFFILFVF